MTASQVTAQTPYGVLELSRELQLVSGTETVPDTKWRFVDLMGHEHQWVDGELPSLRQVVLEHVVCDGDVCGDPECDHEWDETEWVCVQCEAVVKPRTLERDWSRSMVMSEEYTLGGEPISRERGREIVEEISRTAEARRAAKKKETGS